MRNVGGEGGKREKRELVFSRVRLALGKSYLFF